MLSYEWIIYDLSVSLLYAFLLRAKYTCKLLLLQIICKSLGIYVDEEKPNS